MVAHGNLPEALKAFRENLTMAEGLAQNDPANTQARIDLGTSNSKLGALAEKTGDRAVACRYLKTAQALFEGVVKSEPDSEDAKRMAESAAEEAARVCG